MTGMIGTDYRTPAINALIGVGHGPTIPDVLWGGFLDASGDLVAMTGLKVKHAWFSEVTGGMGNSAVVDCGVAGAGWSIAYFGVFDAASGGSLVVAADIRDAGSPLNPTSGQALRFSPGALTFTTPGWTP